MFGFGREKAVTLETQLEVLAQHGIQLLPDRTIEELLMSCTREIYESEPYILLLQTMGADVEMGPACDERFSNDIWHFDTECIEDEGSYIDIAERMVALAKGGFPITNIHDHVDIEAQEAWIEFQLDGQRKRYEPKVEDDWVDSKVFSWFVSLLDQRSGITGRFTYIDLGGQDCLIGFSTPQQRAGLKKATGLNVRWLS